MLFWPGKIALFILLLVHLPRWGGAAFSQPFMDGVYGSSVSRPLPPEYTIHADGAVALRICFNWSCARRETLIFTQNDMAHLKRLVALCPGQSLHDRLQQVRIGIWQMELLAQKYQPLLANDLAINDFEGKIEGRMDCIDNTSNTTTYLHILRDIGELPGWTVSSPIVRSLFDFTAVHWTAVIIDTESGMPWSVDSWYRPNGHLPLLMPLQSWMDKMKAWEPPFERINTNPESIHELCNSRAHGF